MGLFDKKNCDICGGKIGLLGNRKLSDGNLCKECAGKLSPFFSERKQSTVEQIREQLEYREANKEAVANFNVSKMFGKSRYLFIDESAGNFMVNYRKDYKHDNPDVIPLSAITRIDVDTNDHRSEIKRKGADGKEVSYNPPRYENYFDIYFIINVNHPYFDEIRFEISDEIMVETIGSVKADPTRNIEYQNALNLAQEMRNALQGGGTGSFGGVQAEAAAPKHAVLCPHCGATTMPTSTNCCEYCGGALPPQ